MTATAERSGGRTTKPHARDLRQQMRVLGLRNLDAVPFGQLVDTASLAIIEDRGETPFPQSIDPHWRPSLDSMREARLLERRAPLAARLAPTFRAAMDRLLNDGRPDSLYRSVREAARRHPGVSDVRPYEAALGRAFVERHAQAADPLSILVGYQRYSDRGPLPRPALSSRLLFRPTVAQALLESYGAVRDANSLTVVSESHFVLGAVEAFTDLCQKVRKGRPIGSVRTLPWNVETLRKLDQDIEQFDSIELSNANRIGDFAGREVIGAAVGGLLANNGELILGAEIAPWESSGPFDDLRDFANQTLGSPTFEVDNISLPQGYVGARLVYDVSATAG